MKNYFGITLLLFFLTGIPVFAQKPVSIMVKSAGKKEPIQGCLVKINQSDPKLTDQSGEVTYLLKEAKTLEISAALLGYFPNSGRYFVQPGGLITIELKEKNILSEEVVIQGIVPLKDQPTTFSTISGMELSKNNFGQDLPYLLQSATSVISTSDAGAGIGYTGLSIRGSDATRVNVTINGIPLNDSESHGVFWVNTPDLAGSVDEIQLQRGVGSSSNGSAAFGASLNLQTTQLKSDPYAKVNLGAGSFDTRRFTLSTGTGLVNDHFCLDVRLSKITSGGFIDRAQSDLEGLFLTGSYFSEKRNTKFNFISGKEQTFQAWNGVPEARLKNDTEEMKNYVLRNGLSIKDSLHLFNSNGRTYNPFTYQNQTDNYHQNHYQLFHTEKTGKKSLLNLAFHLTTGKGYYEEYKEQQSLNNYGISNYISGNDTLSDADLIRQRWLDNLFTGSVYSFTFHAGQKNTFITGGGLNYYEGNHFGKVIWTGAPGQNTFDHEYYRNKAIKKDINHYAKYSGYVGSSLMIFADLQCRFIDYRFEGYNANFVSAEQKVNYLFFNPKFGLTYFLKENSNLYLSYAKSGREPVRDDFVNSSPQSRPKAEILHNTEAGWRYFGKKTRFSINHYFMYYQNQLVLTGKINDVGAYTRTNVDKSYRTGVEAEFNYSVSSLITLKGNTTYSMNRVLNYSFYNYNYDTGNEDLSVFSNTPIAFSPDLIACGEVVVMPLKNMELGLLTKHVGRQFLDNTGDLNKSIRDYTVFNLRGNYVIEGSGTKQLTLKLLVNNLFSKKYETHGYTYGYYAGGEQINENFYFPQAGINFLAGLQFSF